jgi:pyruvate dehydrogenase E2 component (dihydrolipoamide acetyltransferase)
MFEFKMPRLGADMDQGTLLEWHVQPGDAVHKGDIVAVVDTSKGAIDIEVFVDGVIEELLVQPETEVPVGTVMAHIRTAEQPPPESAAAAVGSVSGSAAVPEHAGTRPATVAAVERAHGRRISPRARRLARQLQVDLSSLRGSGPEGAIVAEDVQAAAGGRPAAARDRGQSTAREAGSPGQKVATMRAAIAAAMSRAKREIPHYYLSHEVDVTQLLSAVEDWNMRHAVSERLLPAILYYRAVGLAASEFSAINGHFADARYQPAEEVNVGIAISLREGGLIAPCLMDVPGKTTLELMKELKDLVRRARQGGLRASELSAGTLTVSNLGDRGVDLLTGVIYPPQVALIGIGSVRKGPRVVEDSVQVREVVQLSLAADHRVSDGHTGALFLRRLAGLLEDPTGLLK